MIAASRVLTQGFPLVRADFYVHRGRLLLGELSLNPVGGYTVFRPEEWNRRIGDWLELPDKAALAGRGTRRRPQTRPGRSSTSSAWASASRWAAASAARLRRIRFFRSRRPITMNSAK